MATGEFIEDTPQTNFVITPIGTSQRDVEVLLKMNAEQFRLLYPAVNYRKLDRTNTKVDDLYKESVGFPIHKTAILVPTLIIYGDQKKLLKRYGIEEEHEAACVFSNRVNAEVGVEPSTGDLIEYLGIDYEILTVKFTDYITNTQVPLNLIATMKQSSLR